MRVGRRSSFATLIAAISGGLPSRGVLAQSGAVQGQMNEDELRRRGAPTGRVGAASRGERGTDGRTTLDLVAPQHGTGLTASRQPTLYYIVSGPIAHPMQLAISARGQARPLADIPLPPARSAGLQAVSLQQLRIRLVPDVVYVWSVAVTLDPRAPSSDLVASALLQHRAPDPALEHRLGEAAARDRPGLLAQAGFWYDAVAAAEAARDRDSQAALASLLRQAGLALPAAQQATAPGR